MLIAEGLRRTFGPIRALAGFDLVVRPGEVVGLIGHNGAGKTTFARVVSGLVRPDAGRITVAGLDPSTHPRPARGQVGLAPQHPALYPTATARENLRVFGGLAGLRRRTLRAEIEAVAAAMHLDGVLDRRVSTLSGGQFRRVQTATALLHRPPVLLLDEPTVGADPVSRQALLGAVRRRADEGAAVCYTTHYLPELDELDATLAVAAQGRVVARGTRADLLDGLPGELRVRFDGAVPPGLTAGLAGVEAGGEAGLEAGGEDRTVVDGELRIRTSQPDRTLAGLVSRAERSGLPGLRSVDVRRPSLDDLYRRLAVEVPDAV